MHSNRTMRRRLAVATGVALIAAAGSASADLVYGTLSNFDVYNDTGERTYGFEIEFDDLSIDRISYSWVSPHYGNAQKIQQGTTAKLRYEATFAGGNWSAFTEVHPPGGQVATDGHS